MKIKEGKGITLIALIVTIIVLLILAGITIATLTGDNGIVNQANNAKEETEISQWEERIDIAILNVERDKNNPTMDDIINELIKDNIIGKEDDVDKETGNIKTKEPSYVITGKLDDYIELFGGGEVADENTEYKDKLGNMVWVPKGFKVVNINDNVENGIIIEDVTYEKTKGSQFVWIPVGTVHTTNGDKKIELSRYTFDTDGTPVKRGSAPITTDYYYEYRELTSSSYKNIVAKNINLFTSSVNQKGGYYIARYEARDGTTQTERTSLTSDENQIVCTANNYVYNYIDQVESANLSRNMYDSNDFTSDLMNSYAWDTAIVFLQICDNRKDNKIPYSIQPQLSSTLAIKGSNNEEIKDEICNIFDLAGNCFEWTTETHTQTTASKVMRGAYYLSRSATTSTRSYTSGNEYNYNSFRPILYF